MLKRQTYPYCMVHKNGRVFILLFSQSVFIIFEWCIGQVQGNLHIQFIDKKGRQERERKMDYIQWISNLVIIHQCHDLILVLGSILDATALSSYT